MGLPSFFLTMLLGFFTVFLLGWQGYSGPSADWVSGLLAVLWSLTLMLRIMALTDPIGDGKDSPHLAQKLMSALRQRQEENRQKLLENAFGGSYPFFLIGILVFALWQFYCAAFPAQDALLGNVSTMTKDFLGDHNQSFSWDMLRAYDWGQGFLLFLSLSMMGFVMRSVSRDARMASPALIVLCGYAVAGYIFFLGLSGAAPSFAALSADFVGNGSGAASFFLGSLPAGKILTLFDIILLESGIVGLAILSFLLCIPMGYIALSMQNSRCNGFVCGCGIITGCVLILAIFLPFTPALGGFFALCWMALFLAWGHAENATSPA